MANDSNEGWIILNEHFNDQQKIKKYFFSKKQIKNFLNRCRILPIFYFCSDLRRNGICSKYLNVVWMIIVFLIKPTELYKYSWRECLPSESMRDNDKDTIFEIYQPKVESSFEIEKSNRTIYFRGYNGDITNRRESILNNFQVDKNTKNCTFTTSDGNWLKYYLEHSVDVIWITIALVDNKGMVRILNPPPDYKKKYKVITLYLKTNLATKSTFFGGPVLVLAYYLISHKLKVYGLNCYQNKKLSSLNFIEFIISIFFYARDYKSKDCVETSLSHLFFTFYFNLEENLEIEGNLDYFKNYKLNNFFTKRIKSIYLKNINKNVSKV